jgi:hypothetical protein
MLRWFAVEPQAEVVIPQDMLRKAAAIRAPPVVGLGLGEQLPGAILGDFRLPWCTPLDILHAYAMNDIDCAVVHSSYGAILVSAHVNADLRQYLPHQLVMRAKQVWSEQAKLMLKTSVAEVLENSQQEMQLLPVSVAANGFVGVAEVSTSLPMADFDQIMLTPLHPEGLRTGRRVQLYAWWQRHLAAKDSPASLLNGHEWQVEVTEVAARLCKQHHIAEHIDVWDAGIDDVVFCEPAQALRLVRQGKGRGDQQSWHSAAIRLRFRQKPPWRLLGHGGEAGATSRRLLNLMSEYIKVALGIKSGMMKPHANRWQTMAHVLTRRYSHPRLLPPLCKGERWRVIVAAWMTYHSRECGCATPGVGTSCLFSRIVNMATGVKIPFKLGVEVPTGHDEGPASQRHAAEIDSKVDELLEGGVAVPAVESEKRCSMSLCMAEKTAVHIPLDILKAAEGGDLTPLKEWAAQWSRQVATKCMATGRFDKGLFRSEYSAITTVKTRRLVYNAIFLNEFTEASTYQLPTVDEVISGLEPGDVLVTFDLKHGFHGLVIHPAYTGWLCFRNSKGRLFKFVRVPFGVNWAPLVFCTVTGLFMKILRSEGINMRFMYVDDGAMRASSMVVAEADLQRVEQIAEFLGIGLNTNKTQGPATRVRVLGVEVDSLKMTVSLSVEKLCCNIFHAVLVSEFAKVAGTLLPEQLLQQMAGRFEHMTQTTAGGRNHVSALWAAAVAAGASGWTATRYVRELGRQADWWRQHARLSMPIRRHVTMFESSFTSLTQSDASGVAGFAAGDGDILIWGRWNTEWTDERDRLGTGSSTAKELYALMCALQRFASHLSSAIVAHKTDNVGVCFGIIKGRSASGVIQAMLDWINGFLLDRNMDLLPWYIPREFNTVHDAAAAAVTLQEAEERAVAACAALAASDASFSLRRFTVEPSPVFEWDGTTFEPHVGCLECKATSGSHRHPVRGKSGAGH